MTTAGWRGMSGGSIEGCWFSSQHFHGSVSANASVPSRIDDLGAPGGSRMLLGTGLEDYFNNAFGFGWFSKIYHNDNSGLSHMHASHPTFAPGTGQQLRQGMDSFSAYRYFDGDPLTFAGGRFALVWRNGGQNVPAGDDGWDGRETKDGDEEAGQEGRVVVAICPGAAKGKKGEARYDNERQ